MAKNKKENKIKNEIKSALPANAAGDQPKKNSACLPLAIIGIIFYFIVQIVMR